MGGVPKKNMSYAAIIPFFKYEPALNGSEKVLFRFFQLQLRHWIHLVDKVYIVDSGCGITKDDLLPELKEHPKVEIITKPPQSHWQNMNETIRHAKEDVVLLLDSDMVIYDWEKLHKLKWLFEQGEYHGMGIFDSSGGVAYDNPLMQENENRFERRRFCPYFFFLRKDALREDFDFTPRGGKNWTDSMGTVTEQLLEDKKRIFELPDDRSTISLEDTGEITHVQWLDAPPKKWAMRENPDKGFYHIRNFGAALQLDVYSQTDEEKFQELVNTMPQREALRLIAWYWVILEKLGDSRKPSRTVIAYGMDSIWPEYMKQFRRYHKYLEKI